MAYELTHLQIINRILPRLRESTVASWNTTDYSTFISYLLNQVKTEIEEAYFWNSMRDTYQISTTAGITNYAFTGAGSNAVIISGFNTTHVRRLTRSMNADFDNKFFGVSAVQTGPTTEYLPAGVDVNHDLRVDIWPSPDAVYVLKFNLYVPQEELAADATVPLVPQNVLIEETIARALAEKGDESLAPLQPGQTFYRFDLLATAVAREAARDGTETDWEAE